MLRSIAGLETISSGEIKIGDRNVTEKAARDRNVAMVFQDYALYPHKSVYENIAFGLRVRKADPSTIDDKVRAAAAKLNLTPFLERKPGALSGGQRQRVAIGRAIVRDPDLFLFDEPLSNLDAKLRGAMRLTIARLQKELGATSVYVTHDQVEAMTLADRIVVLEGGHIQQIGAPMELYHNPANVFVATFIGSPPMNILEGRLLERSERLYFSGEGIEWLIPEAVESRLLPGTSVKWGLRPENLRLTNEGEKADFEATVILQECLGHEQTVFCDLSGREILVKINGTANFKPGDRLALVVDSEQTYLFDAASGLALVRNPQ